MKTQKKTINELSKVGFKKTAIKGLYLTKNGLCYNANSKRNISPTIKGNIVFEGKNYNLAKLLLQTFKKIAIRNGAINFKNGICTDFEIENLEYVSTIIQPPPIEKDLINCIRLYFAVEKTFKKRSPLMQYYLFEIAKTRNFVFRYDGKDFDLFIDYLKTDYLIIGKSQNDISNRHGYTNTNGKNAINKYLNLLINECLTDFENGLLTIKDFALPPPTKTQTLKKLQKLVYDIGLKTKIPLRNSSVKETYNRFKKQSNEISKL